jgi:hypothetical protein
MSDTENQENQEIQNIESNQIKKRRGRPVGFSPKNVKYKKRYRLTIESLGIVKDYASIKEISRDLNLPLSTLYRLYRASTRDNYKYKYTRKGCEKWQNYKIEKLKK